MPSSTISTAVTSAAIGRLAAAHKGYAYQDLLCAYAMVASLGHSDTAVTVDRKIVDDDRFDDLEIRSVDGRTRRQIKHSEGARTVMDYAMFNGAGSSVRLDRLVQTFVAEGDAAAREYRLCAMWQAPPDDDRLVPALEAWSGPVTVGQAEGPLFRLRADVLWPEGSPPLLPCLAKAQLPIAREDVIRFCERFVIELQMPAASLDLDAPGALELSLLDLLSAKVGVGRYPNADRDPVDVAALAIHVAGKARADSARLTAADIARRLAIRTDFGRIVQAFPLDRAVMQSRLEQRAALVEAVGRGGHHLILGAPGAGKSWLLTQVADDLKAHGHIVARHYCFLEPGDSQLEQRVKADVFFGNLLGEISDALDMESDGRLSAGPEELEARLATAALTGKRVILIIDGLDHIRRVRHSSVSLSDIDTDIVAYLAELRLPPTVTLLLGSQPGAHLDQLNTTLGASLQTLQVVPWRPAELEGLARSHGLPVSLARVGLAEPEAIAVTLDLLAERSEGNPLYASYLIRGLQAAIEAGEVLEPQDWLNDAPAIQGDIAAYYAHLYARSGSEAQAIADLLGVIDFSVTEAEIVEMAGPMLADWVAPALAALSPVLSRAASQGGIRVFHESFRRFMIERQQTSGRRLGNVLGPVIGWLDARGFFTDARSYRFLFPLLVRAGRESEVLARVDHRFAQDSVAGGHPESAIEGNLWLASDVAAKRTDWESLVRCGELLRAVANCFDDGTNEWDTYWQAFIALHGAANAAERLLFDGAPTLGREQGLRTCALIDAAGEVAPWAEYFALPFDEDRERPSYGSDLGEGLTTDETTDLAAIRGRLRLGRTQRLIRQIHTALCYGDDESEREGGLRPAFIRQLGRLLSDELPEELIRKMARRGEADFDGRFTMPARYACALRLGAADAAHARGDQAMAREWATGAGDLAGSAEEINDCIARGATVDEIALPDALADIDLGLKKDGALQAAAVRRWTVTVRLIARRSNGAGVLDAELARLAGAGWYRCWLRFVIAAARVGAAQSAGETVDPSAPFHELTRDMNPFTGTPRAVDLYEVRQVMLETLAAAMAQLRTRDDWQNALKSLLDARRGTESRFDHEDGGPVTTQDLFRLLKPFASFEPAQVAVNAALEELLRDTETWGTYYSTHAVLRMHAVEQFARDADQVRAHAHWRYAVQFLLGYGYRKDPTLYDLVESVPALAACDPAEGRRALVALQPLVMAAYRHTDTRGTKGLPSAWYKALLKVDVVLAMDTLTRSLDHSPMRKAWWVEDAVADTLVCGLDAADPLLLDALWTTVPFVVDYQGESSKRARERLAPLEALMTVSPAYAKERFVRLVAEVAEDSHSYLDEALVELFRFAKHHGMPWPRDTIPKPLVVTRRREHPVTPFPAARSLEPGFPTDATYADLTLAIRRAAKDNAPSMATTAALVTALSYHITAMVEGGAEHRAARLVRLFAEEPGLWYDDSSQPLPLLASCLEHSGHVDLAVLAFTLAFTSARGGRGWLNLGGQGSSPLLDRALALDPVAMKALLAATVAHKFRTDHYAGTSRHLIEQLARWEAPDISRRAWWAAFEVQESRLALPGPTRAFQNVEPDDHPDLTVNEALAGVLLRRIGEPVLHRKTAALAAFRRLLARDPLLFAKPLLRVLTLNTTVASLQAVLLSLVETPQADNQLIEVLRAPLELYASTGGWLVSVLANELLSRLGCAPPAPSPPTVSRAMPPTARGHALTMMGDRSTGILGVLDEVWPGFSTHMAGIMSSSSFDNEHTQRIINERWEIEHGRGREAQPKAAVLSWARELFLVALDDELAVRASADSAGAFLTTDVRDAVMEAMVPRAWLHISVESSRVPRPAWPAAHEATPGIREVPSLPLSDPEFGGWRRLAWHEFAVKRPRRHGNPELTANARAGIVSVDRPSRIPPDVEAIVPGFGMDWWGLPTPAEATTRLRFPQPMAAEHVDDLLGQHTVLVAPVVLLVTLGLLPSSPGERLCWRDSTGQPAVLMRSWRIRGQTHDVENYEVEGSDLIVRPDVFAELAALAPRSLCELCTVTTSRLDVPQA